MLAGLWFRDARLKESVGRLCAVFLEIWVVCQWLKRTWTLGFVEGSQCTVFSGPSLFGYIRSLNIVIKDFFGEFLQFCKKKLKNEYFVTKSFFWGGKSPQLPTTWKEALNFLLSYSKYHQLTIIMDDYHLNNITNLQKKNYN